MVRIGWIVASIMVPGGAGSRFFRADVGGVAFDAENYVAGVVLYHQIGMGGTIIEQFCYFFPSVSSGMILMFFNSDYVCDLSAINGTCVIE